MQPSHRRCLTRALLSLVIVAPWVAPPMHAQQPSAGTVPVRYVVLDYMKVAPGKTDEYIRMERENWKPFHKERVANKRLVAWAIYGVSYTAETERQYDFVTVNVYDSFGGIDGGTGLEEMFRRVNAGKDAPRLIAQMTAARQVVRREVWHLLDETIPRTTPAIPSKYIEVDYMRSKPNGNYVDVEQKLWKPIHQERVKDGSLDGWALYELTLPGGTLYPYDYATVNSVSTLAAMENPFTEALFRRVHPNTSLTDIGNRTEAGRDLVRRELWVLVDRSP